MKISNFYRYKKLFQDHIPEKHDNKGHTILYTHPLLFDTTVVFILSEVS